jgi:hypothetical protein
MAFELVDSHMHLWDIVNGPHDGEVLGGPAKDQHPQYTMEVCLSGCIRLLMCLGNDVLMLVFICVLSSAEFKKKCLFLCMFAEI